MEIEGTAQMGKKRAICLGLFATLLAPPTTQADPDALVVALLDATDAAAHGRIAADEAASTSGADAAYVQEVRSIIDGITAWDPSVADLKFLGYTPKTPAPWGIDLQKALEAAQAVPPRKNEVANNLIRARIHLSLAKGELLALCAKWNTEQYATGKKILDELREATAPIEAAIAASETDESGPALIFKTLARLDVRIMMMLKSYEKTGAEYELPEGSESNMLLTVLDDLHSGPMAIAAAALVHPDKVTDEPKALLREVLAALTSLKSDLEANKNLFGEKRLVRDDAIEELRLMIAKIRAAVPGVR